MFIDGIFSFLVAATQDIKALESKMVSISTLWSECIISLEIVMSQWTKHCTTNYPEGILCNWTFANF